MPDAVFGDFLAAARNHLEAAVAVRGDEVTWPSAIARELSRLVAVMSRYCDDLAPCDEVEAAGRDDLHPWERAAIDAGAALRIAAGCLRRAAVEAAGHRDAHCCGRVVGAARLRIPVGTAAVQGAGLNGRA